MGKWEVGFFGVSSHVDEVDMGPNMAPSRRVPRVPGGAADVETSLFALRCVEMRH